MATTLAGLDAHEQPSDEMRAEWKGFTRLDKAILLEDPRIDDPRLPISESGFLKAGEISRSQIATAFSRLGDKYTEEAKSDAPILYHPLLPGVYQKPEVMTTSNSFQGFLSCRHWSLRLSRQLS